MPASPAPPRFSIAPEPPTLVQRRLGTRRAWPLMPLPPLIVVFIGLAVAVAIGALGIYELGVHARVNAAARAKLVSSTLGARLVRAPKAEQPVLLRRANQATGIDLVIATPDGQVLSHEGARTFDAALLKQSVAAQVGDATVDGARLAFAAYPVMSHPHPAYLVAFAVLPAKPEARLPLLQVLSALTTLLIVVAAVVAYAVARDANRDVVFIAERVRTMNKVRTDSVGKPVPIRTIDEVGWLTAAFNELIGRFAEAERNSRADLERVEAMDRERAAFLAAVSHELRSPLNAILGFADLLLAEVDGPLSDSTREEVDQIRASGQHLNELVSDILDLSALESGQLKLSRAQTDLVALSHEVVREAWAMVVGRPLDLRVEGLPVLSAFIDARRIRQVLTNLIGNAVKFTQRGEVVITLSQRGRFAHLSVRDTGPGISVHERALIFDEYKQTKEERGRRRGTGLGLAIARRLVMMHSGSIQVESEVAKGSTFHVFLPMTPEFGKQRRWV